MKFGVIGAALLSVSGTAAAICLNPLGCGPKNFNECIDEASRRPTDAGVGLARRQCYAVFKQPAIDRANQEAEDRAQQRATLWQRAGDWTDLAAAVKVLGKPDFTSEPSTCSPLPDVPKSKPTLVCRVHYWADLRKSSTCGKVNGEPAVCYFQLQTIDGANYPTWVYWVDSIRM